MDDLTDFQKEYLQMLREEEKEELANNADIISSFKEYMSIKGIILTNENFNFYRTTGIIATYPNIINHLHNSLTNDKEGLMNFKNLCRNFEKKSFITGYLYSDKFMLMAHSYFRRGFHEINNYAPRFIDLFWNIDNSNIETFISIDTNRVRINVDDTVYMEADTWFGAQFKKDIKSIADGNVKLRPPMDIESHLVSFFFSNVYSLDIKWETKIEIKSFQAEEFKSQEITILKDGKLYYPARYIHAEFDIEKNYFRHFDGAIHFYTEEEYYRRRDSDFNYNNKSQSHIKTLSQKLYKMNGQINVDTWIEFSSHFLTGNPLVFEYFEGKYPDHINDMLTKVRLRQNKD